MLLFCTGAEWLRNSDPYFSLWVERVELRVKEAKAAKIHSADYLRREGLDIELLGYEEGLPQMYSQGLVRIRI